MIQFLILTFVVNIALAGMVAFALQPTLPFSGFSTPNVPAHQALSDQRDKNGTEQACMTSTVIQLALPDHTTSETPPVPKVLIALPEPLSCCANSGRTGKLSVSSATGVGI